MIKVGDGGDDGGNSANHGDNGNDSSIDVSGTSMFVAKGGGGGAHGTSKCRKTRSKTSCRKLGQVVVAVATVRVAHYLVVT